jgi:hypothetical protein
METLKTTFRSQLRRDSQSDRLSSVDRRQEGGHTRRLGARRVLHGPSNGIKVVRFYPPIHLVVRLSISVFPKVQGPFLVHRIFNLDGQK